MAKTEKMKVQKGQLFQKEFEGLDPKGIKDTLDANCETSNVDGYTRRLTEDEIKSENELVTKHCVSIFELEEELKGISKDFKDRIKTIKEQRAEAIKKAVSQSEYVTGQLFIMEIEGEKSNIAVVDVNGQVIDVRKRTAKERQKEIKLIGKVG